MTSKPLAAVEALTSKIDWLSERGALVMRATAIASWLGAVAATIAVFVKAGTVGWILAAACLIPGAVLWRYGAALGSALDVDLIRSQLGEAAGVAKTRLGEVVDGLQSARRHVFRGAFRVVKTVRLVRSDLSSFGVDVSGIARITNPASVAGVVASVLATIGLWLIAAIGVIARFVF